MSGTDFGSIGMRCTSRLSRLQSAKQRSIWTESTSRIDTPRSRSMSRIFFSPSCAEGAVLGAPIPTKSCSFTKSILSSRSTTSDHRPWSRQTPSHGSSSFLGPFEGTSVCKKVKPGISDPSNPLKGKVAVRFRGRRPLSRRSRLDLTARPRSVKDTTCSRSSSFLAEACSSPAAFSRK